MSQIVRSPVHPYAQGLLASTVHGAKRGQRLGDNSGNAAVARQGAGQLLVCAAMRFCAAALRRALPPNVRMARTGSPMHPGRTRWRCRNVGVVANRQAFAVRIQPPIPGSAQRSIWKADRLLGLMRIERAGAGRPALGQDLHREQFRIDFGFEGAGRADRAVRAVVGFHGFVRPKGHVPDIGLRHAA